MLARGKGVKRDYAEAAKWFAAAARKGALGSAEAQNEYGSLYFWGRGVKLTPKASASTSITRKASAGTPKLLTPTTPPR